MFEVQNHYKEYKQGLYSDVVYWIDYIGSPLGTFYRIDQSKKDSGNFIWVDGVELDNWMLTIDRLYEMRPLRSHYEVTIAKWMFNGI